jgi:hypothetical protein
MVPEGANDYEKTRCASVSGLNLFVVFMNMGLTYEKAGKVKKIT